MNEEAIRQALQGDAKEVRRRRDLLDAILTAFNSGGPEAAARVLEVRMEKLETEFDKKIEKVEEKL